MIHGLRIFRHKINLHLNKNLFHPPDSPPICPGARISWRRYKYLELLKPITTKQKIVWTTKGGTMKKNITSSKSQCRLCHQRTMKPSTPSFRVLCRQSLHLDSRPSYSQPGLGRGLCLYRVEWLPKKWLGSFQKCWKAAQGTISRRLQMNNKVDNFLKPSVCSNEVFCQSSS